MAAAADGARVWRQPGDPAAEHVADTHTAAAQHQPIRAGHAGCCFAINRFASTTVATIAIATPCVAKFDCDNREQPAEQQLGYQRNNGSSCVCRFCRFELEFVEQLDGAATI